jgi:hypothetical protein
MQNVTLYLLTKDAKNMKRNDLHFLKSVLTSKTLAVLVMVIFSGPFSMASDRYSVATGNWNQSSTWSATSGGSPGALAPVAGDNVYIEGGFMVTTANTSNCNNLSIAAGATLNVGGFILNVNGTTSLTGTINHTSTAGVKSFIGLVTINTGGIWDNSANEDINFRGGLSYSGTTFSAGTGVHTFTINNQVITGTLTIPKVTVNVVSLTNNGTLTVSTNLAGSGELINSATGILNLGGVSGITTLTATASGNAVNYTDGAQTVHIGDYFNLGLSGTGKKTLQSGTDTIGGDLIINGTSANATTVADLLITGNLSIGDGNTFTAAGFALTVGGTTTVGAGTGGKLAISSATGVKLFTGLVTIGGGRNMEQYRKFTGRISWWNYHNTNFHRR